MKPLEVKVAVPVDLVRSFRDQVSGAAPFDRVKAVSLGMAVAQWLTAVLVEDVPGRRFKAGRVSAKQYASALEALGSDGIASKRDLPAWLLPVTLHRVQMWLEKA